MKPRKRSDIEVSGNLEGEDIPLSLDEKSLPHLMNMYIRIYQNPEMAALREYATNARDSHIAAGKSKVPIKISLPNQLQPVLTIEDEGVGLSPDDFRDIYSKYGASTKRGTDKQTGSLGIGCKSALAYCAGFNIAGVKDGIRTLVSITRDRDGASTMKIIGKPSLTKEPNGVRVEIPAPLDNNFEDLANHLFQFWPKGSVLVNGKEIPIIEGLSITKNIIIVPSGDIDTNYIVMGGVPYEYTGKIIDSQHHKVVAYVEMGSVDFAPSRETLELTPDTKKRIEQIGTDATTGLAQSIQKQIDKAKNHVEAAGIMAENVSLVDMRSNKFFYKGEEIPYSIEAVVISSYAGSWRQGDHEKSRAVGIQAYTKQLVVKDYTPSNFVASHKKKIEKYIEQNNLTKPGIDLTLPSYRTRIENYLCFPDPPKEMFKWVDPKRVVDWETIRKIKLPSVGGGGVKVAGTYECWNQDGPLYTVDEDDIDTVHTLLYTTEYKNGPTRTAQRLLKRYENKYTIAYMAGNRLRKFKRLYPMAISLQDHTYKLSERFKKELTATEKVYLKNLEYKAMLEKLNPAQIKDVELRKLIRIMQNKDHRNVSTLCSDLGLYFTADRNPLAKYPLLAHTGNSYYGPVNKPHFSEHATIYINAAYGESKKKESKKVNV